MPNRTVCSICGRTLGTKLGVSKKGDIALIVYPHDCQPSVLNSNEGEEPFREAPPKPIPLTEPPDDAGPRSAIPKGIAAYVKNFGGS